MSATVNMAKDFTHLRDRPPLGERLFRSAATEEAVRQTAAEIADPELRRMFCQCLPNTLDTTVYHRIDEDGLPDTFVLTGDVQGMWFRDSANQVWPYLRFAAGDEPLRLMLAGVIRRQARNLLLDPYANAFNNGRTGEGWPKDNTVMRPEVHERKYELDSLAAFLRLSGGYWQATRDRLPFDKAWVAAVRACVDTIRREQDGFDRQYLSP